MCVCVRAEENCCRHLNCVWLSECVSMAPKSTPHFRQQPVPRRQAATLEQSSCARLLRHPSSSLPTTPHLTSPHLGADISSSVELCMHNILNIYIYKLLWTVAYMTPLLLLLLVFKLYGMPLQELLLWQKQRAAVVCRVL